MAHGVTENYSIMSIEFCYLCAVRREPCAVRRQPYFKMASKFQFYKQLDAMDCGATCLRMIARHYGRYYSLDYLRNLTFQNSRGSSLLGISDAGEQIGFHTIGAKISLSRMLDDIPMPLVAHWKNDHFVVVIDGNEKSVTIADPAHGINKVPTEEFIKNWIGEGSHSIDSEGIVLLMEPTTEFFERDGQKVDKGSMSYVWGKIKSYKLLVGQLAVGVFLSAILLLLFPFLVQAIVDTGIDSLDFNLVLLIMVAWIVMYISQAGLEAIQKLILLHIGSKVNISMLTEFMMKILKLPINFFDAKRTDDIIQRLYDSERVERFLADESLSAIFSAATILVLGGVLAKFDWIVFGIFVAATLIHLLWTVLSLKRRRDLDYKRYDQAADTHSKLTDLIRGMEEIKLNNAETQMRWNWERSEAKLFRVNRQYVSANDFPRMGAEFISEFKNIFIIVFAAAAVIEGSMTLGTFAAILFIIAQLREPIKRIVHFILSYQDVKISLERMNEIHQLEDEENPLEKVDIMPDFVGMSGENVSFRYDGPHSNFVLQNLDFIIPQGKTTAIVGPSGSGKTTLLKLLLNFYPPENGLVKLGEISLQNLQSKLWRNNIGVVMQDGYIFAKTIAQNIALGETVFDSKKLLRAAKIANIQGFIDGLPRGFNTLIGAGGVGLSAGQKKRILIARAVYDNPEFLFLDEATNDLDYDNETIIMRNIKRYFGSRTVVILAHKVTPIIDADHIIMLKDGRVEEAGSHSDLTERRGAYYRFLADGYRFED